MATAAAARSAAAGLTAWDEAEVDAYVWKLPTELQLLVPQTMLRFTCPALSAGVVMPRTKFAHPDMGMVLYQVMVAPRRGKLPMSGITTCPSGEASKAGSMTPVKVTHTVLAISEVAVGVRSVFTTEASAAAVMEVATGEEPRGQALGNWEAQPEALHCDWDEEPTMK